MRRSKIFSKFFLNYSNAFDEDKIVHYYAMDGHKGVEGWLSPLSLSLLKYLHEFQSDNSIKGNIAEIGVYKGRFFIALCLLLQKRECALAIDVFGDQQFNLDNSGEGDFQAFNENLRDSLGETENLIHIIQSDSKLVSPSQILDAVGGQVRLFSVDGCHTKGHTLSDLTLALDVLAPGGVIILDDFGNSAWPGVIAAAGQFLSDNCDIVPIGVGYNKLYLARRSYLDLYTSFLENIVTKQIGYVSTIDVFGYETLQVLMPPPEKLFADFFLRYIDFSIETNPEEYLLEGWYSPENWGVWSDSQQTAELRIDSNFIGNKSVVIIISFHAFVTDKYPQREIDIFINSKKIDTALFVFGENDYINFRYQLSKDYIYENESIKIGFCLSSASSPAELGLSADKRHLGIGLRNIRFARGGGDDRYVSKMEIGI